MSLTFQPFAVWTCGSQGAVPSPATEKELAHDPLRGGGPDERGKLDLRDRAHVAHGVPTLARGSRITELLLLKKAAKIS
jgi:hypothetical protein